MMHTHSENQYTYPKKNLILGSGALRIGQAGEFDYSGSQAIKALKEENIQTILVNPNIATVQTDPSMADTVYLQPLNLLTVEKIIEKERPDSILLGFGGQTALNLGLELHEQGILKKYSIQTQGTSPESIRKTENRQLFKETLEEIGVKTPLGFVVSDEERALKAAEKVSYPLMLRLGFSLGGLNSGRVENEQELKDKLKTAFIHTDNLLIEEYLTGWKEVEYEVVRDAEGNAITVCNMENFDPMGIHTGESIVVAPSQTLNNHEYHMLREIALKTVEHLDIVGECNIQYALSHKESDYRVIEINARLSRSSALASKATGYPLAFIAAKLALGKKLHTLKNTITQQTSAFFEPALDYITLKIPRWDIGKFPHATRNIGSEMKSVGEVMSIGRSFPECLQKAIRMLNIGASDLDSYPYPIPDLEEEIQNATDRRIFAIYSCFKQGASIEHIHKLSGIDHWFLSQIKEIVDLEHRLKQAPVNAKLFRKAKKYGFSDKTLARLLEQNEVDIRKRRQDYGIYPYVKQIDTLAGEFPAETNYLYMTYHGQCHDLSPSSIAPIVVLGSGPYCMGSSVEFDWCAVNTVRTLRKYQEKTIMINSNPETVSTDYDESDRLYFEELSLERIRDIVDFEKGKGIIISVGGQISNNLAICLEKFHYPILGTQAPDINRAENRKLFSSLLNHLNIDQPLWQEISSLEKAKEFGKKVGYPLLLRPSYVLSGAAMNVIFSEKDLSNYLKEASLISPEHPIVISQFIENAKEFEIDGAAIRGKILVEATTEHVENAGVHSGDATLVIPPQRLYLASIRRAKSISKQIVKALNITGPFNIQFIAKDNAIKVIECNVRASRSLPFVSKVTGHNFIEIATKAIINKSSPLHYETLELNHVGIKTPMFSYQRIKGSNPVAHVEMASTGEVACIGDNFLEAFLSSWTATEQSIKGKNLLISIGGDKKSQLFPYLKKLDEDKWNLFTTEGTHDYLAQRGVSSRFIYKTSQQLEPNVTTQISSKNVDLIINLPQGYRMNTQSDGYQIRRLAIDNQVPLITNAQLAKVILQCLAQEIHLQEIPVKSWRDFMEKKCVV